MGLGVLSDQRFVTPLKAGLLIVAVTYFLFTLHATFTLEWIGEWDRIAGGAIRTIILVEDVTAFVCLIFRFLASIIALAAVIFYFVKKGISKQATYRVLRVVIIFEAIYWLGLVTTTYFTVASFASTLITQPTGVVLQSLLMGVIPSVVESIILPIVLFILAFKLSPNKPLNGAIKWATISGIFYVLSFWLVYSSIWIGVVQSKGIEYLITRPENILSFVLTVGGLLAIAIYMGYFAKKSSSVQSLGELKQGTLGIILLALGIYFLWNYLSWVILAGAQWNDWYAMFLGHNMNLWMLSLPLVGLPLLFYNQQNHDKPMQKSLNGWDVSKLLFAVEGVGAAFIGVFLAAYLGGLFVVPQTTVFHSDPTVRLVLTVLGLILLVLVLATVIVAILKRK